MGYRGFIKNQISSEYKVLRTPKHIVGTNSGIPSLVADHMHLVVRLDAITSLVQQITALDIRNEMWLVPV